MRKGFCLDLHISVISDVKNIILRVYGNEIQITHWCISDHHDIIGMERANVEIVNHMTWKQITKEMIEQFQKKYWDFLSSFDFFIVTHSPVFALLYAPFGKPIICINSCRYEQPFSVLENFEMWRYLNSELYRLTQQGILTVISNNKADRDYLKIATDIDSIHIPSLCLYTNTGYNPKYRILICFDSHRIVPITNFTCNKNILITGYKWEDLYKFIGIIHIPYEISTMSIFEQYSACIPLFFPTKRFLKELIHTKTIEFQGPYNNKNYIHEVENAYGEKWIDFWLDKADYYDYENMPYITYFDSIQNLFDIIPTINFIEIHEKMKLYNQNRIQKNASLFVSIFNRALEYENRISYLLPDFQKHIGDPKDIKYIVEVGARWGYESISLSRRFSNAKIFSFECNPDVISITERNLKWYPNIRLFKHGLGNEETELPFYSCTSGLEGSSSFLERIDKDQTQKLSGNIQIRKLGNIIKEEDIPYIDILCMDVQGFELNVLQGCEDIISKIHYIIMEEPKREINTNFLPEGVHSKYLGCPKSEEIIAFMKSKGFIEIERIAENMIEDNVMYRNINFSL